MGKNAIYMPVKSLPLTEEEIELYDIPGPDALIDDFVERSAQVMRDHFGCVTAKILEIMHIGFRTSKYLDKSVSFKGVLELIGQKGHPGYNVTIDEISIMQGPGAEKNHYKCVPKYNGSPTGGYIKICPDVYS